MQRDYVSFIGGHLKIDFKDLDLYVTAFTHRSYLNEHRKLTDLTHNERLEFLGDAVLELSTTQYLYREYDEPEGVLTTWRSALVRTESIGDAASKLGFEPFLRLSKGERRGGSERARLQILANSYEAVIGAIYIDLGFDAADAFIARTLLVTLDTILEEGSWRDSKSRLQEIAQARESQTPQYKVLSEEGPDHEKMFTIGVFISGIQRGEGVGPSKQIAQQAAAEEALEFYKQNATSD